MTEQVLQKLKEIRAVHDVLGQCVANVTNPTKKREMESLLVQLRTLEDYLLVRNPNDWCQKESPWITTPDGAQTGLPLLQTPVDYRTPNPFALPTHTTSSTGVPLGGGFLMTPPTMTRAPDQTAVQVYFDQYQNEWQQLAQQLKNQQVTQTQLYQIVQGKIQMMPIDEQVKPGLIQRVVLFLSPQVSVVPG